MRSAALFQLVIMPSRFLLTIMSSLLSTMEASDALRLELNRVDPNDKDKRKKVNKLAEKLVECAIEDKQAWAFQQIADRLEGKPVQVVDAMVDDHRTLHEFSDAELTAILRRRVGVVPVESDEERPEGGALN
jgi:septum formation inhibitor-activating ATPase MinD